MLDLRNVIVTIYTNYICIFSITWENAGRDLVSSTYIGSKCLVAVDKDILLEH